MREGRRPCTSRFRHGDHKDPVFLEGPLAVGTDGAVSAAHLGPGRRVPRIQQDVDVLQATVEGGPGRPQVRRVAGNDDEPAAHVEGPPKSGRDNCAMGTPLPLWLRAFLERQHRTCPNEGTTRWCTGFGNRGRRLRHCKAENLLEPRVHMVLESDRFSDSRIDPNDRARAQRPCWSGGICGWGGGTDKVSDTPASSRIAYEPIGGLAFAQPMTKINRDK
jgi:hypothetical protein